MTASAFAAGAAPASQPPAEYVPGRCNIGPEEIARRRRAGHVGAAATLALLGVLIAIDAPPLGRLLVGIPAIGAASGYLQAVLRFCAGYGTLGVFNFGRAGRTMAVPDPAARARDRRRSLEITALSVVIGAAVGIAAALLPF